MSARQILTPEQKVAILREHLIEKVPVSQVCLKDAKRGVEKYVLEYTTMRPHSDIGYVTPPAMLEGRQQAIFDERDRSFEEARALPGQNACRRILQKGRKVREFMHQPGTHKVSCSCRRGRQGSAGR